MAITAITSVQEFDEKVLGAKGLAIVDFWAGWCEPCTVMRPEIEDVAAVSYTHLTLPTTPYV